MTFACHLAGHKLLVAGSATLEILATAGTTATHAQCHVVLVRAKEIQDGLKIRVTSHKAFKAKGRLNNVDDVFHY